VDAPGIRVADSDREQLAEELREHMLAGRLTAEEFEERLAGAYRAVTQAELDALRADLPMGLVRVQSALTVRRAKLRRRLIQEGGGALGLSGLCVAIWAVTGAHHGNGFWPIWVIIATMIPVVRNAWRLFGPAPDVESVERHLNARAEHRSRREHRRSRHRHHGPPRPPGLPR
jgi:hypothetical protein